MEIEMQRDALHPEYAMPVRRAGDVRKTGQGKQMYTGTGWVDCDGRTLLTVDYPMLFAALAYSFGGGGGQFKLPDLRENGSQVHPESALPSRAVAESTVATWPERANIKTWQERCDITRKPVGKVEIAMAAEIAELRAALAKP